jgi:hypothetical protein
MSDKTAITRQCRRKRTQRSGRMRTERSHRLGTLHKSLHFFHALLTPHLITPSILKKIKITKMTMSTCGIVSLGHTCHMSKRADLGGAAAVRGAAAAPRRAACRPPCDTDVYYHQACGLSPNDDAEELGFGWLWTSYSYAVNRISVSCVSQHPWASVPSVPSLQRRRQARLS